MAKTRAKISIENPEKAEAIDIKDGVVEKEKAFLEEREVLGETVEKFYNHSQIIERPMKSRTPLWLLILIAVFFGLASGSAGGLFVLSQEKINLPFLGEINLVKYFPTREITLVTEKKVTVTEEQRIVEVVKQIQPTVARIYLAKKTSIKKSGAFIESIYRPFDILGLGLVLTNDGWLVTTASVVSDPTKDYLVATVDNKVFPVKKFAYDTFTGFVFLKTDLENMPVAKMAEKDAVGIGQKVFLFNQEMAVNQDALTSLTIRPATKKDLLIYSTEELPFYFGLKEKYDSSYLGAPVFSLDKSVVGLVNAAGYLVPIYYIRNIFPQVLEAKQITGSLLGIEYLDMVDLIGLDDPRYQEFNSGAIVYGVPNPTTPAAKAGLQNGDLIIKINGLPFNGRSYLTDLVQAKKPGQNIEFTVIRGGKELILTATLGSF